VLGVLIRTIFSPGDSNSFSTTASQGLADSFRLVLGCDDNEEKLRAADSMLSSWFGLRVVGI
jgi:hypothetical protein